MKGLVIDAEILSKAAVDGNFPPGPMPPKHQGEYRKVVQGVNDTLDAVIGPLNVSASMSTHLEGSDTERKSPTPTTATSTSSRTT